MKTCLETTSMSCSRENLIELKVIQQNEKSIQCVFMSGSLGGVLSMDLGKMEPVQHLIWSDCMIRQYASF